MRPKRNIEPNYASGALNLLPIKKRKTKYRHVKVGEIYECDVTKRGPFTYPFRAEVIYINDKSAVVKIISTDEVDDYLIEALENKTVVEFKNMKLIN